jgi:hypothetical protein
MRSEQRLAAGSSDFIRFFAICLLQFSEFLHWTRRWLVGCFTIPPPAIGGILYLRHWRRRRTIIVSAVGLAEPGAT